MSELDYDKLRARLHSEQMKCGHCADVAALLDEVATLRAQVARVETLAGRWADVLDECKEADPRWILDRSVTTLETALTELRTAAALAPSPATNGDES
jgi:hypothetical protein